MAIALVQKFTGATSGHTDDFVDASFPGATTTGNFIIIGVTSFGATQNCTGITDNAGNTYTEIGSVIRDPDGGTVNLFYAKNITGNATPTLIIQMAEVENIGGSMIEYSGVDLTSPIDNGSTGTGTGTSSVTGSFTPSVDNCQIFAIGTDERLATTTVTAATNYTLQGMAGTANNSARVYSEDRLLSTAASITAGFGSLTSVAWAIRAIAIKPATAPSGGAPKGTLAMMGCGM